MNGWKSIRTYKTKEIFLLILTILAIVLIFDSKGLLKWAHALSVGEPRRSILGVMRPVYIFNKSLNVTIPKDNFDTLYKHISGIKTDPGYTVNLLNDNIAYEVKVDSSKLRVLSVNNYKIYNRKNKLKAILIGDSMMGWGFGVSMENYLDRDSNAIAKRYSKVLSGLSRLDFFNWFSQMENIFNTERYDIAIVMMGTNDGQSFEQEGVVFQYNTPKWRAEYGKRVNNFIKLLLNNVKYVYWVSLPPMRSEKMQEIEGLINSLAKKEVKKFPNAEWIESRPVLGDADGKYQHTMLYKKKMIIIRHEDGIHFTNAGGELLSSVVYNKIYRKFYKPLDKQFFSESRHK
jgi:lysophospholipase L1-like esterase